VRRVRDHFVRVRAISAGELKEELSARGLGTSGKKAELVGKLREALENPPAAPDASGTRGGTNMYLSTIIRPRIVTDNSSRHAKTKFRNNLACYYTRGSRPPRPPRASAAPFSVPHTFWIDQNV
jgi:hypothetical protein